MGGLFGKNKKKKEKTQEPKKEVKLDNNEKAILDLKVCRDKIKKYIKKLEENSKNKKELAKTALKDKNKEKAKMQLKLSKMLATQAKSAYDKLSLLEDQLSEIEQAISTKDVMDVLRQGNETLANLQKEVNVDKLQEIQDDMEELKANQDEINDFFISRNMEQQASEEVQNDLDKLISECQKEEGIDLPSANNEELTEEQKVKEKEKKEMVEA